MTPSDRISPPCSATAIEIVSAWTSNPTNFILFIDRLLSLVALYCRSSDSQHNPRLRIGAGRSVISGRCSIQAALLVFSTSGFRHFGATKPVGSETHKQHGCQLPTMVLLGTPGPSLFRVVRGGLAWIIHDFAGGKRKGALKD